MKAPQNYGARKHTIKMWCNKIKKKKIKDFLILVGTIVFLAYPI